ncbi:MAG: discoidin domain-containing protein [Kofleriaceae bacterium]
MKSLFPIALTLLPGLFSVSLIPACGVSDDDDVDVDDPVCEDGKCDDGNGGDNPANGPVVVSLSFSDTLSSQRAAITILEGSNVSDAKDEDDVPGTFYVNSPRIGANDSRYLNVADLKKVIAMGGEIGGHTISHDPLDDIYDDGGPAAVRHEVCDDKTATEAKLGITMNTFGYAKSGNSPEVMQIVGECFLSARETGSQDDDNPGETIPPQNPLRIRLDGSVKNPSLTELKKLVTSVEAGRWAVVSFHGVVNGNASGYETNRETLSKFIDWLRAERAAGRVIIKTPSEVVTPPPPPPTCTTVAVSAVTASGDDGNVAANVLDNNLATRWSSFGEGQWIQLDLGAPSSLSSLNLAWYKGNVRSSNYVIAGSLDGETFTTLATGQSSGSTTSKEPVSFEAAEARYLRITVNGNSQNAWASISDIDVCAPE